jgi:hypothetical protein
MRQYIISYDLYRPGHNYSDLTGAIKRLGEDWDHPLANLWIVDTDLGADEIRGLLSGYLHAGDKLYIREAGKDISGLDISIGAPMQVRAITSRTRTPGRLLARVLPGEEEPRLLTAPSAGNW